MGQPTDRSELRRFPLYVVADIAKEKNSPECRSIRPSNGMLRHLKNVAEAQPHLAWRVATDMIELSKPMTNESAQVLLHQALKNIGQVILREQPRSITGTQSKSSTSRYTFLVSAASDGSARRGLETHQCRHLYRSATSQFSREQSTDSPEPWTQEGSA